MLSAYLEKINFMGWIAYFFKLLVISGFNVSFNWH